MMELHHIMMLIHHKLYDSYKLYYCHNAVFGYENKHYLCVAKKQQLALHIMYSVTQVAPANISGYTDISKF